MGVELTSSQYLTGGNSTKNENIFDMLNCKTLGEKKKMQVQ